MKTALLILLVFILLIPVSLFVLGQISKSGSAPGLANNKLTQCPDSPNCICSEYPDQVDHYIKPIAYDDLGFSVTLDSLKDIVKSMGGIIVNSSDVTANTIPYFSATFTSSIYGFVDDFEVRIDDTNKTIQFRSASRVGRSDLGVNAERVNKFKQLVIQQQAEKNKSN